MRNRSHRIPVVGMVRGVLKEAVHYMITRRTQSRIIDAGNGEVHEGSRADSILFGLIVRVNKQIHRMTVYMDGSFQELGAIHSGKCFKFW